MVVISDKRGTKIKAGLLHRENWEVLITYYVSLIWVGHMLTYYYYGVVRFGEVVIL